MLSAILCGNLRKFPPADFDLGGDWGEEAENQLSPPHSLVTFYAHEEEK